RGHGGGAGDVAGLQAHRVELTGQRLGGGDVLRVDKRTRGAVGGDGEVGLVVAEELGQGGALAEVVPRPVPGLLPEAARGVLVDGDVVGGDGVDEAAGGVGDVHAVALGLVEPGGVDAVGEVEEGGGGAVGDAEVRLPRLEDDAEVGDLDVA